ncbi:hypothetical protein LTR85_000764 [Meristemomyces frigidus]|nr:hypothetical protein LTR85_000764 [Meristemomyces frigidus]
MASQYQSTDSIMASSQPSSPPSARGTESSAPSTSSSPQSEHKCHCYTTDASACEVPTSPAPAYEPSPASSPPSSSSYQTAPVDVARGRITTNVLLDQFQLSKGRLALCISRAANIQQQAREHDAFCARAADPTLAELGERVMKTIVDEVKRSAARLQAAKTELKVDLYVYEKWAKQTMDKVADKDFSPPKTCAGGCEHKHAMRSEQIAALESVLARARSQVAETCGQLGTVKLTWAQRILFGI